jgi:hypothetical protein
MKTITNIIYAAFALLACSSLAFGGITVSVKSEDLTGPLPNGLIPSINLKAEVEGANPSSLTGEGRHFASTGSHNYWPASGVLNGTVVTLSGTVNDSNVSYLIGSPVEVVADSATEEITLTFGPLPGGPFVGATLVFTGTGRVKISTD